MRILQSPQRIDLLITEVGLPGGMNGRQVADAARASRPNLKIMFIMGYAENAVVGNGHLDKGRAVLTNPFVMEQLARKVFDGRDGGGLALAHEGQHTHYYRATTACRDAIETCCRTIRRRSPPVRLNRS